MNKPATITVPKPADWYTSNSRLHWAVLSRLARSWREAAAWSCRAMSPMPFYTAPVVIRVTTHKTTKRLYDPANLLGGSVKASIDGLVDAGVLKGDDPRYVVETRIRAGEPRMHPVLVLEIEVAA